MYSVYHCKHVYFSRTDLHTLIHTHTYSHNYTTPHIHTHTHIHTICSYAAHKHITHAHTCVRTHTRTCTHTNAHAHTHTCTHTTRTCTHTHAHAHTPHAHARTHTCTHVHTQSHTQTHTVCFHAGSTSSVVCCKALVSTGWGSPARRALTTISPLPQNWGRTTYIRRYKGRSEPCSCSLTHGELLCNSTNMLCNTVKWFQWHSDTEKYCVMQLPCCEIHV